MIAESVAKSRRRVGLCQSGRTGGPHSVRSNEIRCKGREPGRVAPNVPKARDSFSFRIAKRTTLRVVRGGTPRLSADALSPCADGSH